MSLTQQPTKDSVVPVSALPSRLMPLQRAPIARPTMFGQTDPGHGKLVVTIDEVGVPPPPPQMRPSHLRIPARWNGIRCAPLNIAPPWLSGTQTARGTDRAIVTRFPSRDCSPIVRETPRGRCRCAGSSRAYVSAGVQPLAGACIVPLSKGSGSGVPLPPGPNGMVVCMVAPPHRSRDAPLYM